MAQTDNHSDEQNQPAPEEFDSKDQSPLHEELAEEILEENGSSDPPEQTIEGETEENVHLLPIIPMRGMVLFPGAMISFDLNREASIEALDHALEANSHVLLVTQRDKDTDDPKETDLYDFGTVTHILQVLRVPVGGLARVIAQGSQRAKILEYTRTDPFLEAYVYTLDEDESPVAEDQTTADPLSALIRLAHENFLLYADLSGKVMPESLMEASNCKTPGRMADLIGSNIPMKPEQQQHLLEETNCLERLKNAFGILTYELDVLRMQRGLYEKVKVSLDKSQRDYILREQLKAIHTELGDAESMDNDLESYRARIASGNYPAFVVEKLNQELRRLAHAGNFSAESAVLRDYIERVLELPWKKKSRENNSLSHAEEVLDKDHYGLTKLKERIVEFLAVRQNSSNLDSPIICLAGPPGVGKTSIAKSIARALNRKYVRMSLGGVRDESEIRGHRKTYVGAMPGRLIESMRQAGTLNPLILLDEIDKMSSDFRGNPASALLEVLDNEQNNTFRDHYLELPYDLSDVMFICTANQIESVPQPLIDRLEILQLASYTEDEKLHIATGFLMPKQLKKHGLKKSQIRLQSEAISHIIRYYTREAGVRQLERMVATVCRKTVKTLLTEERKSVTVNKDNLEAYLGKKKYRLQEKNEIPEVGVCRGLAWTSAGGDTLSIEVNTMKGSGKFKLTGNIGKVMEESAHAAISYIRSRHEQLSIRKGFYKDTDIHIHIPEGATPKDGPSAGITMATAMVSALTETPVNNQIAMTGEITIRGRILPIGGVKEKILAAKSAGIQKVLLPLENENDLSEINQGVKDGLDLVLVKTMEDVLNQALERPLLQ